MNKILPLMILGILVLSGFGAGALSENKNLDIHQLNNDDNKLETWQYTLTSSDPVVSDQGEYININVKETNSFKRDVGKPMLPFYSKTMTFPLGTKIKSVECTYSNIKTISLNKKIQPAPRPLPINEINEIQVTRDNNVYDSIDLFPNDVYSYRTSGGLDKGGNHVTFLTINLYPVRYAPALNTLQYVENIETIVIYEEPSQPLVFKDEYDMVIISYDRYASLLEPLVVHKEKHNIITKIVTLKDIYNSVYFPVNGRDKPEKIKYFIKDALEQWGITYVMLVGNFMRMPIRYVNLETDKGGRYEELEFLTDLYYADIYDGEGGFCSWDSDNDGIFGEWPFPEPSPRVDDVDLCSDVYVGRLACMFAFEVRTMVNKIIDYEENAYDKEWFKNMIVCGGDTFNDSQYGCGTDYMEGEEATQKALEYMDGFNPIKLWASMGNLNTVNIRKAINSGGGFLYLVGHGNPAKWATHPPRGHDWIGDYEINDMWYLWNKGKYPILMVGGCHNSQFDVTLLNLLINPEDAWYFSTWVPECWSWIFVKKFAGGAIASMGSTGYGCVGICDYNGNEIPDCIELYDGWFETQFFRLYKEENIDILGETYGQTVTDYAINFPVDTNRYDCKVAQTHVLFGDPSLKIGGYP